MKDQELELSRGMLAPALDIEPAAAEPQADAEAAAVDAAGLEEAPPESVRPPMSGAQLIAVTEQGVALLSKLDAHRQAVEWDQELEELVRFNGTERVLLELVADDAATVLGLSAVLPPRIAAAVFGGMLLLFWSSRHAAIKAKAPKGKPSRTEHARTWGLAADAVEPGTEVRQDGFPPPFQPAP